MRGFMQVEAACLRKEEDALGSSHRVIKMILKSRIILEPPTCERCD